MINSQKNEFEGIDPEFTWHSPDWSAKMENVMNAMALSQYLHTYYASDLFVLHYATVNATDGILYISAIADLPREGAFSPELLRAWIGWAHSQMINALINVAHADSSILRNCSLVSEGEPISHLDEQSLVVSGAWRIVSNN